MTELVDRRLPAWVGAAFRAPAVLFRLRLGWLFFGRLLMLSHVGRRTARSRRTVLEVVSHQADPPVWYVAAAWGGRSDWYRNLTQNPHARITVGGKRYAVTAATVDIEDAVRIHREYVQEHPLAARLVGRMLGIDLTRSDPKVLAERIPVVALAVEGSADPAIDSVARVPTTRDETRESYDRIAPLYGLLEGFWERKARAAGLDALEARRGERVIDVGCGPGLAVCEMAAAVGSEGRVIGVDLSSEMCALAGRRLQGCARSGTDAVVQADAVHLPFADSSFDAGFMSFTLELFDTPEIPAVLAECRRILRPGGRLVVVALDKRRPPPPMQRAYEWGHERFPHVLDCRPIHVEASLLEAGYSISLTRRLSLWGLPVEVAVGERS